MKRKNRRFTKLENHNLKQRFKAEFETGLYSINELAIKYNVDSRKLLKWKHQLYGKGSMQQKRIYQMHLAGVPSKAVAQFFGVALTHIHRSIRKQSQEYTPNPQCRLFKND
tara:strand:+ start:540 stop:872 length:333 start_codon:yes stop_codon:yes gene_type:complete